MKEFKTIRQYKESDLQIECLKWFNYAYPKLRRRMMKFGVDANIGLRNGSRLKKMGYKAGSPDILLAVPRYQTGVGWKSITESGLFIELKIKGGSLSPAQKAMHKELSVDYRVVVVYSFDEFKKEVEEYLGQTTLYDLIPPIK